MQSKKLNTTTPPTSEELTSFKRKAAIIPYRFSNLQTLEVLLIRNLRDTKWVIPKGTIDFPLQPQVAATKEAYEEAGVLGRHLPICVGSYYKNQQEVPTYLLEVDVTLNKYKEQAFRERKWLAIKDLDSHIMDEDLLIIVKKGIKSVTKNKAYFKFAIRTFCSELGLQYEIKNKKEVLIAIPSYSNTPQIISIKRHGSKVEFLAATKLLFNALNAIPGNLSAKLLVENAQPIIGFWCVRRSKEKFVFARTYNSNLKLLTTDFFNTIIKQLAKQCATFNVTYKQ